ncbi:UNVERIFIED_CONTAM: hypothetical protein HDU68_008345 [Siphonaria sp. JEL0065]|nr:hypothetical protein HDU68_008345 [Siphonaria sp. JEL0065]
MFQFDNVTEANAFLDEFQITMAKLLGDTALDLFRRFDEAAAGPTKKRKPQPQPTQTLPNNTPYAHCIPQHLTNRVRVQAMSERQCMTSLQRNAILLNCDLRLHLSPFNLTAEVLASVRVFAPVTLAHVAAVCYSVAAELSTTKQQGEQTIVISANQFCAQTNGTASAGSSLSGANANEAVSIAKASLKAWPDVDVLLILIT